MTLISYIIDIAIVVSLISLMAYWVIIKGRS
jgi:hypothetical protein